MDSLIWLFSFILIVIVASFASTKRVQEGSEALVERLGRYHRKLTPGLHFGIIPFVDEMVVIASTKEQVSLRIGSETAKSEAMTADNVRIAVETVVFWRISELEHAHYAVEDVEAGVENLIITTVRSEVRRMSFQEANTNRYRIIRALLRNLDEATKPWGIKVTRVEIQDIKLVTNASDLISLPLPAGVNWKALEQSFLIVTENEDVELKVQSISQRDDGIWVIQVKVPANANKEVILEDLMYNYTNSVQVLEARY
ncbi:hypothetical protein C7B61_09035, partial [filamentous cyanobacterium CCP1]